LDQFSLAIEAKNKVTYLIRNFFVYDFNRIIGLNISHCWFYIVDVQN